MSRIPPPRGGGLPRPVSKAPDENKASVFKRPTALVSTRTGGVKRPGDSQVTLSEKKQRTDGINAAKRNKGAEENENAIKRNAGFSERAKRAALKPIAETVMVRGSLPAIIVTKKAKRPAWDLKGRIQDMEEHFHEAKSTNETLVQRIAALEGANQLLHKDVEIKSTQSEEATSQISKLEKLLKEKTEESESRIKELSRTISNLTEENKCLERESTTLKSDYEMLKNTYQQETTALKSSITSLTCSKSGLQTQLEATELLVENLKAEVKQLTTAKCAKEQECENLKSRVSDLEDKLLDGESTRRKLHNTIQELKGNIRVFCRIRPALPEELKSNMQLANIMAPSPKTIEIQQIPEPGIHENSGKSQKKFECNFDSVFTPTASQQEVFEEISQLVQSSIDGYNVCIFAYGQTGSGKTYTMEGPENVVEFLSSQNESHLGMIPRSVQHIFKCIRELEPRGWKYRVEALFLEIYNERIQDLLNSDSASGNAKCEIIKSAAKGNNCLLSNVEASPVTCAEEVLMLLNRARINRVVAATKCNEYSSRSHYVFQLKVLGENSVTGEKCEGTLNLVDLAGSERVKESGSAGDRLTEAKAINKSLSNLGKVIMALSRKDSHVPYRDSKLTHLLANSLGGNSKTLMFVNISPDNNNLSETINSLRFATMVNQCNIGTAQKRVK